MSIEELSTPEAKALAAALLRLGFLLLFFCPLWGGILGWLLGMRLGGGRLSEGVSTADDWEDRRETASRFAVIGGVIGLVVGAYGTQELWM